MATLLPTAVAFAPPHAASPPPTPPSPDVSEILRPLTPFLQELLSDHTLLFTKGHCKMFMADREGDVNLFVVNGDSSKVSREKMRAVVQLVKELDLPSGSHHPHIRGIIAFLDDPSYLPVTIFEDAGRSLQKYQDTLPDRKIPAFAVKPIMTQLLTGLEWIHTQGVIHRDIHPSRIYISNDGQHRIRISDFGRATHTSEPTDRYLKGAAIYRPPDVHLGAVTYGTEYDMWSVGCIYAEMISGQQLFGSFSGSLMRHIIRVLDFRGSAHEVERARRLVHLPWDADDASWPWHAPKGYARVLGNDWSPASAAFLNSFIQFDPEARITAAQALKSPYLRTEPVKIVRPPTPDPETAKLEDQDDADIDEILKQIMTLHQDDPEMVSQSIDEAVAELVPSEDKDVEDKIDEWFGKVEEVAEETLESLLGIVIQQGLSGDIDDPIRANYSSMIHQFPMKDEPLVHLNT